LSCLPSGCGELPRRRPLMGSVAKAATTVVTLNVFGETELTDQISREVLQ
jgi:hypothetical protein